MNKVNKNTNNKGFTLIELLISVGILAIIIGIGGDILATVVRSYQKSELISLLERNGNYALTLIEQDIRAANTVVLYNNGTEVPSAANPQEGDEIRTTHVEDNNPTTKGYRITLCEADPDNPEVSPAARGDLRIQPAPFDAVTPSNNYPTGTELVNPGEEDFLNNDFYVLDFIQAIPGGTDNVTEPDVFPFTRVSSDASSQNSYDIVYISFGLGALLADNASNECVDPLVRAFFQTSVNLQGGLQQ